MYATTELSKQVYCTVSAGFARFRWLASARGTHNETTRTAHSTDTRIGGVFYDFALKGQESSSRAIAHEA